MRHRRQRAQHRRVHHQNVELAPAAGHGFGQPGDAFRLGEVERSDGGAATGCMNMFLNLLKPARGARGEDDMRAKPGQRLGGGGAYTPARACHKGESSVQRLVHQMIRSASSESRSEEQTSELQSLMRISYAVF